MERKHKMQLVGQAVAHKVFGQGVITDCSGNIVTVSFLQGDKKFLYPDAFADFLILKNKTGQSKINAMYERRLEAETARKQALQEEQERRQRFRALKITPTSQAAFHIDLNELDEIFSSGAISTGCYLSGYSKGKPRIPSKLKPNSACLLTGCPANAPEKERRILGAFMVKDSFWGDLCKNGMVECHDEYKVRLHSNKSMLYWDYFDRSDPLPRWGNMVFKYFPNSTMQRILLAMKKVFQDAEEKTVIHEFYQYFCEINRLPQLTE